LTAERITTTVIRGGHGDIALARPITRWAARMSASHAGISLKTKYFKLFFHNSKKLSQ